MSIDKANSTTPELGIWLKKSAQCHGYGFEALNLLLGWIKTNLNYKYLRYPVDKRNLQSIKLAKKLGGVIADEYIKKSESGNILDEVEYRWSSDNSQ